MDFNEINKLHISSQQIEKKKAIKKDSQNHIKEKINLKETPSDPSYWQNSIGIRKSKISFGNAEKSITPEDLDFFLKDIQKHYPWYFDAKEELPIHKQNLAELSVLGRNNVENYSKLVAYGLGHNSTDSKFSIIYDVSKTIAKKPIKLEGELLKKAESVVFYSLHSGIKKEVLIELIDAVLDKENASLEEKLEWLKIISEYEYKTDNGIIQDVETGLQQFDDYIEFFRNFPNSEQRQELKESRLTISEQKVLTEALKDPDFNNKQFKNFIISNTKNSYWNKGSKEALFETLSAVNKDPKKKVFLTKILDNRTAIFTPGAQQVLKAFEDDIDFMNETLDFLHTKCDENDIFYLHNYASTVINFLMNMDKDNFEDFKSTLSKEYPVNVALEEAEQFINPKTKKYDINIKNKVEELKKRGIDNYSTNKLAKACIDMETGEMSPIAQRILDLVAPIEEEAKGLKGKLTSLKRNLQTRAKIATKNIRFTTWSDDYTELINSLKNNEGHFEKENENQFYNILRANRKTNKYHSINMNSIVCLLEGTKNEHGVADKEKATNIIKMIKLMDGYDTPSKVVQTLNEFPKEKQKDIFDFCTSLSSNEKLNYKNLPSFACFCFDEQGNRITNRIELAKELMTKSEMIYHSEFLEFCEKYPKLKDFLLDLVKYANGSYAITALIPITEKYQDKNGSLPKDVQKRILDYIKVTNDLYEFLPLESGCFEENENGDKVFNEDVFNKAIKLMTQEKEVTEYGRCIDGEKCAKIVKKELSLNDVKFKEKVTLLNSLTKIRDNVNKLGLDGFDYLEKAISDIEASLSVENIALPITKQAKTNFIQKVLTSKNEQKEYTNFEKIMVNSIPLLEKMNDGLTLEYPRSNFLQDLTTICNTEEKLDILAQKTGISPIIETQDNTKVITGYNGIIKLNELDKNNPVEKQIYDCLYEFMYDNKIKTGNEELDEQLNYIVAACPEFINTIGKKQHNTQAYTVDTHSLLVLAYSIQNKDYLEKLNALDRTLLKTSAIFHDIMKQEGVVDKGHQNLSSLYTRSIIKKIMNSPELQDRLYEIIDNHHWTEEYSNASNKEEKAKELAFRFRRPNDFEIAKIMARSDIKAVSSDFYERLKSCLNDDNLAPIQKYLDFMYSTGNVILTDKIVSKEKLENHKQSKDGIEYKVINLHEIDDETNMGDYGFSKNKKKKDLSFLVHMVDSHDIYKSLNTVKLLSSPLNGGVMSESVITPKYKRTYCDRKYGVLLSHINTNIVNANSSNQGSGNEKDMSNIISLIYNNYDNSARTNFRKNLIKNLGIDNQKVSDGDYAQFYKENLASISSLTQINPNKIYKLGKYEFNGEKLREAIFKFQEDLVDKSEKQHNEIVGYTPKIHAVIAKSKNLESVPDELLKFAHENDLPVVLI